MVLYLHYIHRHSLFYAAIFYITLFTGYINSKSLVIQVLLLLLLMVECIV